MIFVPNHDGSCMVLVFRADVVGIMYQLPWYGDFSFYKTLVSYLTPSFSVSNFTFQTYELPPHGFC